jgi:hypothetical protein
MGEGRFLLFLQTNPTLNKGVYFMFDIQPIKLLGGSHSTTAQTGSGCFMNVISYLNGESQITDRSPCVCTTIRRIAIWLNDYANDEQRQRLLPFVLRAMGTATTDIETLKNRTKLVVAFAEDMAEIAKKAASVISASATRFNSEATIYISEIALKSAKDSKYYAKYAYKSVHNAVLSASHAVTTVTAGEVLLSPDFSSTCASQLKEEIFERGLALMEAICPPLSEPDNVIIERAKRLHELSIASSSAGAQV